jgi:hypothetical protein
MSDDDDYEYELPPQARDIEYIKIGKDFVVGLDDATKELLDRVPEPKVITVSGKLRHGSLMHLVIKDAKLVKREVHINKYHLGSRVPDPPGILWTRIARAVMSPSRYRAVWEPHLADMRHEHAECIKFGDLRGARIAVVRAHFYSIPSWIWGVAGSALAGVVRWLSKA